MIGQDFRKFVAPVDIKIWDDYVADICKRAVKLSCDLRVGRPDGFLFYVQLTGIRMKADPDLPVEPSGFVARMMITDITERKRSEEELKKAYKQLKETEQKLIQSEKMAAVGRFSSWVAHEVKNPLGIMLGGLEFLEKRIGLGDAEVCQALATVKDAVLRTNSILESLLHYTKPSDLKIEIVDASEIAGFIVGMVKTRASLANIVIDTEMEPGLNIPADKNQMDQALFNIVNNSMEAMPKGGKILLKVYKAVVPELSTEDMSCVIEVGDTGRGIPKDNISRVAEPFFTTKERGVGTGLGLFIARKIIDSHNGTILIESTEGKGTVVKIVLPMAQQK